MLAIKLASKLALAVGVMASSVLVSVPANADTYFDLSFTQVGTPSNGCCGPFDVSALLDTVKAGETIPS